MEFNFLWLLSGVLVLTGLAGTVLPLLPGTLLVWAGLFLGAWIDDFSRVGVPMVVFITVLAALAWALDFVAGLMGAKRAGASRMALVGAAVGTVVGLFMGLVGVLFMPLVGAAVGEYWAQKDQQRAPADNSGTQEQHCNIYGPRLGALRIKLRLLQGSKAHLCHDGSTGSHGHQGTFHGRALPANHMGNNRRWALILWQCQNNARLRQRSSQRRLPPIVTGGHYQKSVLRHLSRSR